MSKLNYYLFMLFLMAIQVPFILADPPTGSWYNACAICFIAGCVTYKAMVDVLNRR